MYDCVVTTLLGMKNETLQNLPSSYRRLHHRHRHLPATLGPTNWKKRIINICNFQLSLLDEIAGNYSTDVMQLNGIFKCCQFHMPKIRMKSKLNGLYNKIGIAFYITSNTRNLNIVVCWKITSLIHKNIESNISANTLQ